MRGVEYSGRGQKIKLSVNNADYELEVEPYEIFTAMIDGAFIKKVDMLEEGEA